MAIHAISYDLSKPGRNYDALFSSIKALGGWCHVLESTWIVRTDLSAAQVRDSLSPAIDSNDHLLVTEMTGNWAAWNIGTEQASWLKKAA
jgi:hypothetical protein